MDWLSNYMKARYCSIGHKKIEEKDSWPPIKTISYVTLGIVHQMELQTTAAIRLRVKGDMHETPHTMGTGKLTNIAQIFDPVLGSYPNNILIEGHAGIGKTTFVKEMCIKWAEGNLLTSDKLVLLLFLRDPNVQKITNERQLIEYFIKSTSKAEQLSSYLEDNYGVDVTLIIDGFDELNATSRRESFFRELIEKKCLPKAKIVVTSRPYASACLHHLIDKRLEILGFEQCSKNQYVTEALQHSPSKLEKLQRHFQQYPNINAICNIPLIMSIIVFLCMCQPDELPPTSTKMYESFILHIIYHHLKRKRKIPEGKVIQKLEQFPSIVYETLQQLEKTAFDGLDREKLVFTAEELSVVCKDDPTCFGLLHSTESYGAGTPTKLLNFLHLGMQEFFAAKYVTTLQEVVVNTLLKESFLLSLSDYYTLNPDDKNVRFYNMWILYFGITSGQCKALRHYLNAYYDCDVHSEVTSEKKTDLSQPGSTSDQRISNNTETISQDLLKDPMKIFHLFQCFKEAQDDELCEVLLNSFHSFCCGEINISERVLPTPHLVSLGFFLSKSGRKWKELNMYKCYIEDYGMSIIHQNLSRDKINKQEITLIYLDANNLTGVSSHFIADIISNLHPHTLWLDKNQITDLKTISTAVINTSTFKVLNMRNNYLTAGEAVGISDMMSHLEELNIAYNELGDHGAELISEGITSTETLRKFDISVNNIGPTGTKAIAFALCNNNSLEILCMEYNKVGQDGAEAIANAITNNKKLKALLLDDDAMDKESAKIVMSSLHCNDTITKLWLSTRLCHDDSVWREVIKINNKRNEHDVPKLGVEKY